MKDKEKLTEFEKSAYMVLLIPLAIILYVAFCIVLSIFCGITNFMGLEIEFCNPMFFERGG